MRHRGKKLLQGPPPWRTHRITYLLESNFLPHMTWIVNDGKSLRQLWTRSYKVVRGGWIHGGRKKEEK